MRNLGIVIFVLLLTNTLLAQDGEPRKIDEFTEVPCDEFLGRMDVTIGEASENPTSTIYVFVYLGKERYYNLKKATMELVWPTYGSMKSRLDSIKNYVEKVRRFPPYRFRYLAGGFREKLTVEIWSVPPDVSNPPKPTPTLSKIRYRKGKPTKFCTDCC